MNCNVGNFMNHFVLHEKSKVREVRNLIHTLTNSRLLSI